MNRIYRFFLTLVVAIQAAFAGVATAPIAVSAVAGHVVARAAGASLVAAAVASAVQSCAITLPAKTLDARTFGAKGDGVTNDSAALQAAINAANAADPPLEVFLPAGTYLINSGLTSSVAGNYANFRGAGIRSTVIKAGSAMGAMLTLSSGAGFHGRKTVSGIQFDGNMLATIGIDATNLRYSAIRDNEFVRMATDGSAIKLGAWVMRVEGNIIAGYDAGGTTPESNGILIASGGNGNNFVIAKNSFTGCKVGVLAESGTDLQIQGNNFDACTGAAIWSKVGARNLVVTGNYIENCGTTGVQVEKSAGVFQTWYGALVCNPYYGATGTFLRNLVVKNNTFANCSTDSYMSLSNVFQGTIADNFAYETYNATNFVNLRWLGVSYATGRGLLVDHASATGQFTNLVGQNTDDNRFYCSGLTIRDRADLPIYNQREGAQLTGNPANWSVASGTMSVGKVGLYEGRYPIWQIDNANSGGKLQKTITLESSYSQWKGEYLRLNWLTQGVSGANNGIWVHVYADSGAGYVDLLPSLTFAATSWTSSRSVLVRIPAAATSVRIEIIPVTQTAPVQFCKFNVSLASVDPDDVVFKDEPLLVTAAPSYGTGTKGDLTYNGDPDPGEPLGWVCTTAGTPGTWTPFGTTPKVTTVTAASYTVLSTDQDVFVNRAGAVALTLPASPATGQRHFVKDISGAAATNNVTVTPSAGTVDGAASKVLSSNYEAMTFVYNGTEWSVQ